MELKPRTRKEFLVADFIDKDTPDIVPKTRAEMFLKQALDKISSGGSGGGVSSWNDLTDKPFYEEGGMVEILAETTLEIKVDEGESGVLIPNVLDVNVGDKCVVTYNGIEYECEAQPFETEGFVIITLGDAGAATGGEVSGKYPFVIMVYPAEVVDAVGGGATVISLDDSASMTVSIEKDNTVIHPIEGKYLPKGTPWMVGEVYLEESDASSFTHPSFGTMWAIYKAVKLEVGETYTVIYNGTSYNCVCQAAPSGLIKDSNAVAMGNFSVVGGENTGEPFAMLISYAHQEVDIIDLSSASSVKCAIHAVGTIINKVDEVCLPDAMIVTVEESTMTANKTCNEIWEAIRNKQEVFIYNIQAVDGSPYPVYGRCVSCAPNKAAMFSMMAMDFAGGTLSDVSAGYAFVLANGTVVVKR